MYRNVSVKGIGSFDLLVGTSKLDKNMFLYDAVKGFRNYTTLFR